MSYNSFSAAHKESFPYLRLNCASATKAPLPLELDNNAIYTRRLKAGECYGKDAINADNGARG